MIDTFYLEFALKLQVLEGLGWSFVNAVYPLNGMFYFFIKSAKKLL